MKKIITTLFLTVSLTIGSFGMGWSGNFQKGLHAIEEGDYATALNEWGSLAEKGHAKAQNNLGLMYQEGLGVLQDYKIALKWITLSAEQGHAKAQYNLGVMYERGEGVLQDYKTALKWYTLSAEQGDADAQHNLGVMYALGQGVIANKVYAHMWGNIANLNGNEGGKIIMEHLLEQGMTHHQIQEAQRLARECVKKNYKGC